MISEPLLIAVTSAPLLAILMLAAVKTLVMPISSFTGVETLRGRHKDAKFNLSLLIDLLLSEHKIERSTGSMLKEQIERIEDDAFSLFFDYMNKTVEFELAQGGKPKKYSVFFDVKEL